MQVGAEEDGASTARLAFDPAVILDIYSKEMNKDSTAAIDYSRFMMLEFTGFLENYLWPNFAPESSFEHVMCIILVRALWRVRAWKQRRVRACCSPVAGSAGLKFDVSAACRW